MRLQGRPAFVTGASRNIGRAIALAFAAEGADLVLNTRANRDELEAVGEECRARGVRAVCVLGDVGEPEAVTRMVHGALPLLAAIPRPACNPPIPPPTS